MNEHVEIRVQGARHKNDMLDMQYTCTIHEKSTQNAYIQKKIYIYYDIIIGWV